MANPYFSQTGLTILNGDDSDQTDINTFVLAVEAACDLLDAAITAVGADLDYWALIAKDWATKATEVEAGLYSAKYYAELALVYQGGAQSSASDAVSSAGLAAAAKSAADADVVLTHADVVLTHADVVSAEAAKAAAEDAQDAAEAAADSFAGVAADSLSLLQGSSISSNFIAPSGAKSFTIHGKNFVAGMPVTITRPSDPTNYWMKGTVISYNTGTGVLSIQISSCLGSGTYTSWYVFVNSLADPVFFGKLQLTSYPVPASASASGVKGTIIVDADYIYLCTATNTWKRVLVETW